MFWLSHILALRLFHKHVVRAKFDIYILFLRILES
jgi:hypothetical protein